MGKPSLGCVPTACAATSASTADSHPEPDPTGPGRKPFLAQENMHGPVRRARLQEEAGVCVCQARGSPQPDGEPLPPSLLPRLSSGRRRRQLSRATAFSTVVLWPPKRLLMAPQGLLGRESFPGFQIRTLGVLFLMLPPALPRPCPEAPRRL